MSVRGRRFRAGLFQPGQFAGLYYAGPFFLFLENNTDDLITESGSFIITER